MNAVRTDERRVFGRRRRSYDVAMKVAWYSPSGEQVVVGTTHDIREAAASDDQGVAWWIADRHEPTLDEAVGRLGFLRRHGVSPYAFPPD